MLNTTHTDADAEHVVVFVSFQTALFVEGSAYTAELGNCVPVEGYFMVVANPWGPRATYEVIYDKGFAYSPSVRLFTGIKNWTRRITDRLTLKHGISPQLRRQCLERLPTKLHVLRSMRAFEEAVQKTDNSMMFVKNETLPLVSQLECVLDAVQRVKRRICPTASEGKIVFLTLRERLDSVHASMRWFGSGLAQLPPYAVVALEDLIPASEDLIELYAKTVRSLNSNRCAVHPTNHKNCSGLPYNCCREDVRLLQHVGEHLIDYLEEVGADGLPKLVVPPKVHVSDGDSSTD
ncbi:hypothetical protein TraAM80_07470 [Trypanosoma rangeli]|uniref:Uncharacterized protein n=1 Tax=Trypanosoma rangeli TaxID=5698 RepID=A0A3R7NCL0_TRYRA|nr:uncharacterized protein TraAM80_07470 [Trypanosoma rangeli]RNF00652.1 hypothetical protein TraAM80_07470 [Trypanosoma rangeli]|eukprot:RNF00652.1 hypothetical protein TraAM80_07470 [Trypanosoma rangeli]